MSAIYALDPPRAGFGVDTAGVEAVVAVVREASAHGWRIGPEWDEPLQRARAFAEKAKATWWLQELAKARPD